MIPAPAIPADEAAALRAGEAAWPGIIAAARQDPAVFAALVLRDEATAARVTMDPPHVDMQDAMTAHTRCLFLAPQRSGKSNQGYARIIWELGHDHSHRVLLACNTHQNASKALQLIGRLIKSSEDVHAVFPGLLPSTPWGDTQLTVKRRGWIRDPSVRAVGVGTEFTGARVTWCFLDDTITPDNCLTAVARQKSLDWYNRNVLTRLDPEAHVVGVANCIHEDDMFHKLAKSGVWFFREYPVFNADGALAFPHRWTHAAIAERKAECDASSPYDFDRFMLCRVRDDASGEIKAEWIACCLAAGNGIDPRASVEPSELAPGETVWVGMDLADSQSESSDLYAMVPVLRRADGTFQILNVFAGHWQPHEVADRMRESHERYHGVLIPEKNAQQNFLTLVRAQMPTIPWRPWHTSSDSKHAAIEALRADLANGRLIIPNQAGKMAPEIEALVKDLNYYDRSSHTGDRMIALAIACATARKEMGFATLNRGVEVTVLDTSPRRAPPPVPEMPAPVPDALQVPDPKTWPAPTDPVQV